MSKPELVSYGVVTCLNVTGLGEPGGAEHVGAVRALYAVAAGMGGSAGALEGLWWVEDERPALEVPRELWRWHLLLPLPGVPEPGGLERAREGARASTALPSQASPANSRWRWVSTNDHSPLTCSCSLASGNSLARSSVAAHLVRPVAGSIHPDRALREWLNSLLSQASIWLNDLIADIQGRVRMRGPSSVMAMVCSEWAARLPSRLWRVQPSGAVR